MSTTILFLPTASDADYRWLRLSDGRVVARGESFASIPAPADDPASAETVVGVVPGIDVAIHWVDLPDLAEP